MDEIRYFSMFTGVGGFELGLQGATCVGMSEIDKYANELLSKRFLGIKNYGDCTKIKPDELPDFDMLCGGFPCQAFSIAGKRRGFEDTRGTMFFEISRILKIKRPKIILLENVKGLLNHEKGETFRVILQTLDELGYEVQWMVLNSKFFGVPQNRERVFIIGNLRGERRSEILPFRTNDKEANDLQGQQTNTLTARYEKAQAVGSYVVKGKQHEKTILDLYNKKEHADRSPTLTEPHHNTIRVREGIKIRRLTPIECERLQGFPDNWTEFGINEKRE